MRTIPSFFAAVAAFTLLAGCGGKSVVGKWDVALTSTDPQTSVALAQMGSLKEAMEFKEDGNYTMTVFTNTSQGTYELKDNIVTLTPAGTNAAGAPGTLTLSDDGDTMTGTDSGVTATLTRAAAATE